MFIFTFTLLLILIYLLSPLFLVHIICLVASAMLSGRRITEIIHGIVVVKEDCCLPQPPGFFSLESRTDNLTVGCISTDNSKHADKHSTSVVLSSPLDEVSLQNYSHEDLAEEPNIHKCSDDAQLLTRSPSRKFLTPFQKLSYPRVRHHSAMSNNRSSVLKRLSGRWSKQKEDANIVPKTTHHTRKHSSASWLRAIKLIIYPPDASARLYIRELHVQSTSYP